MGVVSCSLWERGVPSKVQVGDIIACEHMQFRQPLLWTFTSSKNNRFLVFLQRNHERAWDVR